MIHFNFDTARVNQWLVNSILVGWLLLEISVVGYIVYLVVHHVPK